MVHMARSMNAAAIVLIADGLGDAIYPTTHQDGELAACAEYTSDGVR